MRLGLGHGLDSVYNMTLFSGSDPLLLDIYTGAQAAWSLRRLSTPTTNVITGRRASDDAELSFTADEITDGTLADWGAGTNVFIKTWLDQSGNNNHLTQTTTTRQPQIVASGTVITENGRPAVQFNTSNDMVSASALSGSALHYFMVVRSNPARLDVFLDDNGGNIYIFDQLRAYNGVVTGATSLSDQQYLLELTLNNMYVNTVSDATFSQTVTYSTPVYVGSSNGSLTLLGKIQELILYTTSQAANRAAINADINGYYSIF